MNHSMEPVHLPAHYQLNNWLYLLVIFIIAVLGGISSFLLFNHCRLPAPVSRPSPVPPVRSTLKLGTTTYSYALIGKQIYLRQRTGESSYLETGAKADLSQSDAFYLPGVKDWASDPQTVEMASQSAAIWTDLNSFPVHFFSTASQVSETYVQLFTFRQVPGSVNFLFSVNLNNENYPLYFYNTTTHSLTEIRDSDTGGKLQHPRIDSFSPDGLTAVIYQFPCWGCEGGPPVNILLVNLRSLVSRHLSPVTDFTWTGNRTYKYRTYKAPDCGPDYDFNNPDSVCMDKNPPAPIKTGSF